MLTRFIQYLTSERRFSEHTIRAYEKDLFSFFEYIHIEDLSELEEITYQDVRGWIVELINTEHTKRTVNRKISSLRTFFKWAQSNHLIEIDPCVRIKGLKQEKRIPEFIKEEDLQSEQMDQLFPDTPEGMRDRLIIEVLYQTGIRLSELIHLKKKDIDDTKIKVLGKRNKERYIPISIELYEELQSYIHKRKSLEKDLEFLFVTDKGNQLYPKFVYRKVKYYLSFLTSIQKKSPHILRHTFATHLLNNGAGLEVLKEILGHADLSATQVYTHNSFEQLANIYKNAHPRG